ncbi:MULTISPECIES: hypothetical protein [Wolbachia]|uniref:hypothetical protein n=1 Tax=Wolbachia TaxID=953 RepID=UPI00222104C7|nr:MULTISPECIES: hypothetical protein [Wolbachia]BDG76248.1 hypothetical protein wHmt_08060 [Wolbachia pipientis]BDG77710.1 hypothetical protein wHmc_08420 [Wolbachia pipientis]
MDNDTKEMLFALGIATSIGALTGLALSFTTLSPLVMGGIVAAVPALLHFAICRGEGLPQFQFSYAHACTHACFFVASAAIGVGLAAAAMAIFPGATLGMGSAALAGAVIAPISVIAGMIATACIIAPIAQKVNEYIISPIVKKVGKCFSSKEEEKEQYI